MMSSDRALQSFCRRKYSPLFSFQRRLRHVRGVNFRNLVLPPECPSLRLELRDLKGVVIAEGEPIIPQINPSWSKIDITSAHTSKGVLVVLLAGDTPLLEWTVHLSGLVFVSRHLPDDSVSFNPDSLLLILAEGVYCDSSCFQSSDSNNVSSHQTQHSSSQIRLRQASPTLSACSAQTAPKTNGVISENNDKHFTEASKAEINDGNQQALLRKIQLCDAIGCQSQRPKVYVKVAALCDVREKILVDPRRLRKSYGVNALNRLSTMERAIRHTTANGRMLQASLESSIANRIQSATYNARCELETLRLRCRALEYHIREREILLDNESQQLAREQDMAVGVRVELDEYRLRIVKERENLRQVRERLQASKMELENVGLFKRQMALICELDEYIYPIVQVPTGTGYTICSILVQSMEELKNPRKRLDDHIISTGIAYVFHLVCMLSIFTGVPLIYPLKYDRNAPVVVDVTFDSFHQKEFPLYVKGKDRLYFEHAVSLLARNVSHLRVHFGLPSMRGRMMAGLYNLLNYFKDKRMPGVSSVNELSGIGSIMQSDFTVSDSNMSSRCPTPDRCLSPHNTPPQNTLRLRNRVHSSVPNLASASLLADTLDDIYNGAASDNVS
ncbi:uncharacterized protein LOC111259737 isoform X2 [Varroa jacobsoni]|uniref:UV radiation resistance-associated gene protein n=1 Tax=Varroa destructor TaxID=109461 RepID=A0A7M7KSR7_VARDE|nr:uncharacterized protein LOC111254644 isoform X2 [Varroa destructor]XP_022687680.1 uncharacterized protein LOC111259737 isoform X2 [Varroa jacobsoni]